MIEAKVICDSIGRNSPRLTTFQLRYPKFIHGELMTHRTFSRNASSSRAVPVSKNLEEVRSDELRAGPVYWGAEQKGMSAGASLDPVDTESAMMAWAAAARSAADTAEELIAIGVHKSIVNRVLEPFLHINVVATSCEPGFLNFFGLRLDKAAQPEIRALAELQWAAWLESKPKLLQPGEWHLPFVESSDLRGKLNDGSDWGLKEEAAIKVSVARCARVSYTSFETGRRSTIDEDLALYERLVGSHPLHASPAEHQATPDTKVEWEVIEQLGGPKKDTVWGAWQHPEQWGNLPGWRQYRKTLPGEAVAPLPKGYEYHRS